MIISIDAEKAVDNIQHPRMIKTCKTLELEDNSPNLIKKIYENL